MVPSAVADQCGDPAVERRVAAAAPVVADEGGDLQLGLGLGLELG